MLHEQGLVTRHQHFAGKSEPDFAWVHSLDHVALTVVDPHLTERHRRSNGEALRGLRLVIDSCDLVHGLLGGTVGNRTPVRSAYEAILFMCVVMLEKQPPWRPQTAFTGFG